MKFFLDTANLQEIRDAAGWGAIDGITTNPSLVAKERRPFTELIREICAIVDGPVSAETIATDAAGMVAEGRVLAKIHPNVIIKCPLTKEGLKATRQLSSEHLRVNVTLCFSPTQALLAAKAGAYFISPFVGRLDDIAQSGMELIRQIKTIYANYQFKTQILAASVRHPIHVVEAATIGADCATMPLAVLEQLVRHPLTDIGLARFLKDWETIPQEQRDIVMRTLRPEPTAGRPHPHPAVQ
ncbi:MAG: fructose-6-phosphate aldolase [Candidatus Omnitrophica bacterium]|nr:fructose-6-phosphate aldolase [Candidatus Omnitrophota bacterium]